MARVKTVIEINGRKYDARTGALLPTSDSSAARSINAAVPSQARATPTLSNPTIVDGVSRRKPQVAQEPQPTKARPMVRKLPSFKAPRSLDIKPAHKKPQRSTTLLRSVVVKPQKNAPLVHSTSSIAPSKVEHSATGRGLLLKRVPDIRLSRAKQTAKSITISRFSNGFSFKKQPTLQKDLTVALAPQTSAVAPVAPAITKPVLAQKQQVFVHPIAHATNHASPRLKKDRLHIRVARKLKIKPRVITISMASIAAVVLLGFLAYQNVPSIAMRVAASQAGFSGNLPGSTPAGFAFNGPITYGKGFITLKFNSNSDNRNFALTQRPSDWTSESLLTNHILTSSQKYQTYHDKGLTVYIYSNGDATWVDKGVWYNLTGKGSLSSEQILSLAGSM